MKKLSLTVAIIAVVVAATAAAQEANPLSDFTRPIKYDGLSLSVVHMNERTVEILYAQSPTKAAMKVRSKMTTFLYVQGTPQKDFDLDTTVTIEQGGEKITGSPHSIKNFEKKKIAKGERIDGLVEFTKKIDIAKPFKVKIGSQEVEFVLSPEALKSIGS